MGAYQKDMLNVIDRAMKQGWRHELRNGHHHLWPPEGPKIVASGTPSDHRAWANFMALMRGAGYEDGKEDLMKNREEKKKAKAGHVKTRDLIKCYLKKKAPEPVSTPDMTAIIRPQIPDITESAVRQMLMALYNDGEALRVSRGLYAHLEPEVQKAEPVVVPAAIVHSVAPVESPTRIVPHETADFDRMFNDMLQLLVSMEATVRQFHGAVLKVRKMEEALGVKIL